jgi:predicted aspartyl protease
MNYLPACARLLLILALLLALAPCQANPRLPVAKPAPLNEADGYRFAFQYDPPRIPYIIIQVSINGKPPLPFLLDTGTNATIIIDTEAASKLGLKLNDAREGTINGKNSSARTTVIKSLRFPSLDFWRHIDFAQYPAFVIDLSTFDTAFLGKKPAGIIGVSLLEQFTVRLDFPSKVLTLYLKPHPPISISGATTVPLVEQKGKHRYFVQVSPAQNLSAGLLLDTGSVKTSLPLAVASQIQSTPRYGDSTFMLGSYYISQTLLLPKIKVGDYSLDNFAVSTSPVLRHCTLGIDLLSCFRVTLDFPHHQMFLERAADRPYQLQGWGGFTLKPSEKEFRVKTVEAGSPAEVAGLQVDDEIRSIDGRTLHGLSLDAASRLRNGFAGTRATLLIQRGQSQPFTLSFVRANLFAAPPDIETGLTVEKPDKKPINVVQVDAGSPAQRAGLVAGDTIIALDGVLSVAMSADQTDDAFGKDKLTLTVRRPGESKPRVLVLAK